ncbi:MAG: cytochrome c oxidase assembly protein [Actinomycetota bacterium]|nr:cytochrome c oxidase assembly protein [Actinomycetota bacterium]
MSLEVLTHWTWEPLVVTPLAIMAVGLRWAVVRIRGGSHPGYVATRRIVFLAASLLFAFVALESPVGFYADRYFSVHMIQHLVLTLIVAPLFVLGAPITLALQVATPRVRRDVLLPVLHSRPVRVVAHPIVSWGLFALVLPLSHIPAFYDLTLRNDAWHAFEHLVLVVAAILFWWPVVSLDPLPRRLAHPARVLYLFLIMPVMTFTGLAVYNATQVWYPHYAALSGGYHSALSDQNLAGALMWEAGMFLIVPALGAVLIDWMNHDEKETAREDARRARGITTDLGVSALNGKAGS